MCLDWFVDLAHCSDKDRVASLHNVSSSLLSCPHSLLYNLSRHCIVGGVIDVGIAALGADGVIGAGRVYPKSLRHGPLLLLSQAVSAHKSFQSQSTVL